MSHSQSIFKWGSFPRSFRPYLYIDDMICRVIIFTTCLLWMWLFGWSIDFCIQNYHILSIFFLFWKPHIYSSLSLAICSSLAGNFLSWSSYQSLQFIIFVFTHYVNLLACLPEGEKSFIILDWDVFITLFAICSPTCWLATLYYTNNYISPRQLSDFHFYLLLIFDGYSVFLW